MTPDQVIIADPPLTAGQILITQDLYSTDQTLAPGGGALDIRETGITIGQPTMYSITPGEYPALRRRPDQNRWNFTLIHFCFDLEDLPPAREYAEATFAVRFSHNDVTAHDLYPQAIVTAADAEHAREFTVGPALTFAGIDTTLTKMTFSHRFRYQELHPVITAFGAGKPAFRWKLTPGPGTPVFAGTRAVFALLQLPRSARTLSGEFHHSAQITRTARRTRKKGEAVADTLPFTINPADGTFSLTHQP